MNIQEAKEEIIRTLRIYTQKKPNGEYLIPIEKQRPILLIGPPGIGKTAIMKQIAEETGMGLVSYTMTHHTRQSAIGLPFITERTFGGEQTSITEYTMSEIVASIYLYMEKTGLENGILFLDEINCVSETLAPVMLQLLQNKTFGNHPLPQGWLIVAAGNPPEYNKSVREMDMVTLDRVKNMDIEADLDIWQEYAVINQVHPAIRAYLRANPDHFYRIDDDVTGRHFATARGWEDLSVMLTAYEASGEPITETFILQYIQHDSIAHSFFLFRRYFHQFCADTADDTDLAEVDLKAAAPSEVLALSSLLFHSISVLADTRRSRLLRITELRDTLAAFGGEEITDKAIADRRNAIRIKQEKRIINAEKAIRQELLIQELEKVAWNEHQSIPAPTSPEARLNARAAYIRELMKESDEAAHDILLRIERAYAQLLTSRIPDEASLFFTTDLTNDKACCQLLAEYECETYNRFSLDLLKTLSDPAESQIN